MDFPKKQAQRLMPLYLLEYSEKLFTNHPDPSAPWGGGGGGGSDYTAGQGITITNNEISVDTNVVATKEDIPTNYVTLDTEQTITGLKTIGQTSGTISEVDFSGFTFKLSNKAINHPEADIKIRNASYDGYQYPTIYSTKGLYVNLAKIKLGDDGSNTYGITMPDSSTWEADRVLATTNDIPTVNNPTITFTQGGVAKGTITLNQSNDQTIELATTDTFMTQRIEVPYTIEAEAALTIDSIICGISGYSLIMCTMEATGGNEVYCYNNMVQGTDRISVQLKNTSSKKIEATAYFMGLYKKN